MATCSVFGLYAKSGFLSVHSVHLLDTMKFVIGTFIQFTPRFGSESNIKLHQAIDDIAKLLNRILTNPKTNHIHLGYTSAHGDLHPIPSMTRRESDEYRRELVRSSWAYTPAAGQRLT